MSGIACIDAWKQRSAGTHTHTNNTTHTHTVHGLILAIRKHQYQTKEKHSQRWKQLRGRVQRKRGRGDGGLQVLWCVCVSACRQRASRCGWCDISQNAIAQFVSNTERESERGRNRQRTKSEKEGGQELNKAGGERENVNHLCWSFDLIHNGHWQAEKKQEEKERQICGSALNPS